MSSGYIKPFNSRRELAQYVLERMKPGLVRVKRDGTLVVREPQIEPPEDREARS